MGTRQEQRFATPEPKRRATINLQFDFADGVLASAGLAHGLPLQVDQFERAMIVEALRRHRGDQSATAAALGIARQTLYDKVKKFGLAADEFR